MWQYYIPTAAIEEEIPDFSSDDKKHKIRVGPSSAKRQRVGFEPDQNLSQVKASLAIVAPSREVKAKLYCFKHIRSSVPKVMDRQEFWRFVACTTKVCFKSHQPS